MCIKNGLYAVINFLTRGWLDVINMKRPSGFFLQDETEEVHDDEST